MSKGMENRDLSGCEKLIMKIVWDAKRDISTPEIIQELKNRYSRDYARTTVVTFIQRLIEKGYVRTYHIGRVSYVHPIKDEPSYINNFLQYIQDFWFAGDVTSFVSAICKKRKLTKEEIDKLRRVIDELDD